MALLPSSVYVLEVHLSFYKGQDCISLQIIESGSEINRSTESCKVPWICIKRLLNNSLRLRLQSGMAAISAGSCGGVGVVSVFPTVLDRFKIKHSLSITSQDLRPIIALGFKPAHRPNEVTTRFTLHWVVSDHRLRDRPPTRCVSVKVNPVSFSPLYIFSASPAVPTAVA